MTKQDFINQFISELTSFANRLADEMFPEGTLFDEEPKPKTGKVHKPYKARKNYVQVGNIARSYDQDIDTIYDIMDRIGVRETPINGRKMISRKDCEYLALVIDMKYNNFNDQEYGNQ